MKLIRTKEELETNRQYWSRSKKSPNEEIKIIHCVSWRRSIAMSFYIAEYMNGVLSVGHVLSNYDVIGPIPVIETSDFDEYLKKEKQDETNT